MLVLRLNVSLMCTHAIVVVFFQKCLFLSFEITFEIGKNSTSILCQELRLVCGDEICVCLLLGPCKIDHVLNIFLSLPFEA